MFDMAILISVLVFFATLLLLAAGFTFVKVRREHQEVVEKVKSGGVVRSDLAGDAVPKTGNNLKDSVLGLFARAGSWVKPGDKGSDLSNLRKRFLTAGIRHPGAPGIFWGARVLCAALIPAFVFFGILVADKKFMPLHILLIVLAVAALGFYIPEVILDLRIRWRKEQIVRGFPDALDLLVVCVEAGMGIDAAINRVAEEIRLSSPVLSDEFRLLNLELRAGKSRADSLRNLGARTDVEEVRSFATLLIQTDRFGTSVAQALRVHSDAMRTQRYHRAEELAAKLPVKLMFPLIMFIFPAIIVVIVGPAAIQIYNTIITR
ncbi:MAG: type II secretion system F family protein [Syntrophales bacterium]|jgi:tight adherence protein C|nr:type II secretion system F family protein [Syntrophales bacterium]